MTAHLCITRLSLALFLAFSTAITAFGQTAPAITGLPASLNVLDGDTIDLIANISGWNTYTVQWDKDGVAISSPGVSFAYSKYSARPSDAGLYTVTFTNADGAVAKASCAVTVTGSPLRVSPPSLNVVYGNVLYIDARINWDPPYTFQWEKDGVTIPNTPQVTNGYYKSYARPADSGLYTVTYTKSDGTLVTGTCTVTVTGVPVAPSISIQPVGLSIESGAKASFSVSATYPDTYQWFLNGQPVAGATGASLTINNALAANAGSYAVVVTNDGGSVSSNAAVLSVTPFQAVVSASSSDSSHALYVKSDGSLWAKGYNSDGQFGNGTYNDSIFLTPVQIATGVVAAAAGPQFSLYIKSDGTLWAMGTNLYGQLGLGSQFASNVPVQIATGVVAVAAGWRHSLYVKADGTLWAMGLNNGGQLGDGTTTNRSIPAQVATGVVAVAAGWTHSLFTKADGTLWAMGYNGNGQLGDGSTTNRLSPVQIATGVASVSVGFGVWPQTIQFDTHPTLDPDPDFGYSLYVKTDGTLWATGFNGNGQLGDGTTTDRSSPVQVASGVKSAAAGTIRSVFVKLDGTLWAMGQEAYALFRYDLPKITHPTQIASGVVAATTFNLSDVLTYSSPSFPYSVRETSTYIEYIKPDGTIWSLGNPLQIFGLPPLPAVPTNVAATSGAFTGITRLTWSPTPSTNSYEVWRSPTNDSTTAYRVTNNVYGTTYFDATAVQGATYYYWIKAVNSMGAGVLSLPTHGFSLVGTYPFMPAADFNGDGKPDLIWSNSITGERAIWLMNGTNFLGVSALGIFPLEWTVAATGDFNGDGKTDIVWSNSITGERAIWLMNGTQFLASSTLGVFPLEWTVAGTGDFNGDGKTDLIWSNSVTGERAIWLMDGTNFLASSTLGIFPLEWTVAATGDFNGDGKPDIIWSNSITGERAIWLMNGAGFLASSTLGIFPLEWTVVGTGDYNGDGKPDIIWSNSITGERALWLMNGTQFLGSSTLGIFPLEWTVKN